MAVSRFVLLANALVLILVAHVPGAQAGTGDNYIPSYNRALGSSGCGGTGCGVAFSVDLKTGAEKTLHSFQENGSDGYYPVGGLVQIGDTFYGATEYGGIGGAGTVFTISFSVKSKSGAERVLYSFNGGTEGSPGTARLLDIGKTLYGTTPLGGDLYGGTVFSVDRTTGVKRLLHSFGSGSDGYDPESGLTAVGSLLYGTTCSGGEFSRGTVYSINPGGGEEVVLFSFDGANGACPVTNLINVGGTLYGTTQSGGTGSACGEGCGTLFSIDPSTGAEAVIYSFNGSDGIGPTSDLMYIHDELYGTTYLGGP